MYQMIESFLLLVFSFLDHSIFIVFILTYLLFIMQKNEKISMYAGKYGFDKNDENISNV